MDLPVDQRGRQLQPILRAEVCEKVEKVVVRWPGGRVEEWKDVPTGTYTTLREGTGAKAP